MLLLHKPTLCAGVIMWVYQRKKAKQLEKSLTAGKPKFKKHEEVEPLKPPGGRQHASNKCPKAVL